MLTVGEVYRHAMGDIIHIVATRVKSHVYVGPCAIAEDIYGDLIYFADSEEAMVHWTRVPEAEFLDYLKQSLS